MGKQLFSEVWKRKGVLAWNLNLLHLTRWLWFESTLVCKCWLQNAPPGCGKWCEGAGFAFLPLGLQFSLQSGCVQRSTGCVEASVLPPSDGQEVNKS